MMILSLTIYLICVFLISKWSVQQLKINYLTETIINNTNSIKEETISPPENTPQPDNSNNNQGNDLYYPKDYLKYKDIPLISVNFEDLLNKNQDTVGWIKVNGTKVNYPIVQTTDNDYYLKHDFNKNPNITGWVYGDYRDNFVDFGKNTIIYAHNMTNRTMFGSLVETQNEYWYTNKENQYIKLSTPTSNSVWAVFSTYTIEPIVDYLRTNFENINYQEFLNEMKSRSIYDFGIDVTEEDKILTLSTCNDTGTKRIVVQAKMVTITYR